MGIEWGGEDMTKYEERENNFFVKVFLSAQYTAFFSMIPLPPFPLVMYWAWLGLKALALVGLGFGNPEPGLNSGLAKA